MHNSSLQVIYIKDTISLFNCQIMHSCRMINKIPMIKTLVTNRARDISHFLVNRHNMSEHILSISETPGTNWARVVPDILMNIPYVSLQTMLFHELFWAVGALVFP